MLQKEVVDRIAAAPGNGDYGRLTVMLAPWVEAQSLFDVAPGRVPPAPAGLVGGGAPDGARRAAVPGRRPLRPKWSPTAFNQRRKTLRNA